MLTMWNLIHINKMQWWMLLILILVALFLLIAVILYTTLYAQSRTDTIGGGKCNNNNDCFDGTVCNIESGTCVRQTECDDNGDCPDGSICQGGRCVTTTCTDKGFQCPIGETCQRGQCQRQTCTSDEQCTDSSFCIGGVCVPNSCKSSYQCPNGYGCNTNNGVCYKNDVPCTTSDECYGGALSCIDGTCHGPYGCPDGWIEIKGFCYPITNPILCDIGTFPIGGVCCPSDEYLGKLCSTNNECGGQNPNCLNGQCVCNEAPVPQTFPSYPFATCSDTSSCQRGKCGFGYCIPELYECVASSNCPFGFTCIQGGCVLAGDNPEGSYCITSDDYLTCINTGRACVNSVCTTKRGNIGDICITNDDCIAGLDCNSYGEISFCSIRQST